MLIVLASKRLQSLKGIIHTLWANFLAWGHHPPRETVFYLEAFLGRGRLRTQVLRISLHITWGSSCLVICRCVFVIAPWAALNDKACVLAAPSASHLLLQAPGEHTSQEQPSSRITDLAHFLRNESQQSSKREWSLVFFLLVSTTPALPVEPYTFNAILSCYLSCLQSREWIPHIMSS